MTSILLKDFADIKLLADDPEERFITSGVSWEQYEALLAKLGDSPWYRVTYFEGVLEIMSPSRRHEFNKKIIAMLVESYLVETRTRFYPLGSTTFREETVARGIEPDECYCINSEKSIPDIAIEVVFTSGGIKSLEVYKGFKIPEVWFWENNRFSLYHLQGGEYKVVSQSKFLPELDLNLLANYVMSPAEPMDVVLEFRERLRGQNDKSNS